MTKFKVDFLGIGAEKSGTTWVADCLSEHPEICLGSTTRGKEIFFFNEYDPHLLRVKNIKYNWGMGWYEKHFSHCKTDNIKGEFSPTYLYGMPATQRIKKHFPKVKLIVVLRNPVDRAFSQYLHGKRIGVIKNISFEETIKKHHSYLEMGLYYKHLSYYYKLFPKKNILVMLQDDIKKNPKAVIVKLYKFLDLKKTNFTPNNLQKKSNPAAAARFPLLNYFLLHSEYFLKENNLLWLLRILEATRIRKAAFNFAHYVNLKPLKGYPEMRKETREKLVRFYKPDIDKLEKLIKRNLSSWKK